MSHRLHPIGRRGVLLAVAALVVVSAVHLAGVTSPKGMVFDEILYVRAGAEYLQGKDSSEWTHPPLSKEIIAVSLKAFTGARVVRGGAAPSGLGTAVAVTASGGRAMWATPDGRLHTGRFQKSCRITDTGESADLGFVPSRLGAGGSRLYAVSPEGDLVGLKRTGGPPGPGALGVMASPALAHGVSDAWVAPDDHVVWAAHSDSGEASTGRPAGHAVTAYRFDGTTRTTIALSGGFDRIAAVDDPQRGLGFHSIRVLAAGRDHIESVDPLAGKPAETLRGGADAFATLPSSLVWAVSGRRARLIEPRGMSVIARVRLPEKPLALLSDETHDRAVAVLPSGLACLTARPTFAWRFRDAVTGALVAALAALISVRCFGSLLAGGLAAAFVGLNGLNFAMSRMAGPEPFVLACVLGAWFCALSWLRTRRTGWLWTCGILGGLAVATKWSGVWALAAIVVALVWDARRSPRALAAVAGALVVVPAAVYVLSYIPYFRLGHSLGDLMALQAKMLRYHERGEQFSTLASPWYGWPVGARAFRMYVSARASRRGELWVMANPAVLVLGLAASLAFMRAARKTRAPELGLLILAGAAQFVPWMLVQRGTFLYHYGGTVPFLGIALGWWLAVHAPRRWRPPLTGAALAACLAVFLAILPMLDGWYVSASYRQAVKATFPWMF